MAGPGARVHGAVPGVASVASVPRAAGPKAAGLGWPRVPPPLPPRADQWSGRAPMALGFMEG